MSSKKQQSQDGQTGTNPVAESSGPVSFVDRALVNRVARLARLAPDAAEQAALEQEMSRILGYFQRLADVDTDGVEPVYHPQQLENRLRPDVTLPSAERSDLLASAKRQKEGCLLVPRTVE
jgi:aspartyl-tRNA(Asn)/glutamyl-tRNA(Gln) amidotransferase subunit C